MWRKDFRKGEQNNYERVTVTSSFPLLFQRGYISIARDLSSRLKSEGWIDPWLDEQKLKPGEDWQLEIDIAINKSDVVIVCLSRNSLTKEGFAQKEIVKALEKAEEKLEGDIFIIPLRLEECDVPKRLSKWHWLNYFDSGWFEDILRSLDEKFGNKKIAVIQSMRIQTKIQIALLKQRDNYEGFISALRWLEAQYSIGMLALSAPEQETILSARKWFDEKRTKDGARISRLIIGSLRDKYQVYQEFLNESQAYYLNVDKVLSYEEMLSLVKDNYEKESRNVTEMALSNIEESSQQSPVFSLSYLQDFLDNHPLADEDRKTLQKKVDEIMSLNRKLEELALIFISKILSDEERIVTDLSIQNRTVNDISQEMLKNSQVVDILINSACEKLEKYYNLQLVTPTILANYLRPYWTEYKNK